MSTLPTSEDAPPLSEPIGAENGADDLDEAPLAAPDEPELGPMRPGQPGATRRGLNSAPADASNREARRREADEDRELILLAQKGDKAAFRRLVERHQRRAFAIAMGLVRDENDARELVQEAFLRVYRGLDTFQGSSSFFTWLYRIVTNLAIDLMRRPGRHDVLLDDKHVSQGGPDDDPGHLPLVSRVDGADPLDVLHRRHLATRIQAALDELPLIHRSVILMREVEGMSYEEMAEAAGVSKGTIMSRLFHARRKMQRALADCYGEDRPPPPPADDVPEEDVS